MGTKESTMLGAALSSPHARVGNPQTKTGWRQFCANTNPTPNPVTQTVYANMNLTEQAKYDAERLRFLANIHTIHTPTMSQVFDLFDQTFLQAHLSASAVPSVGVLLTGVPNCGKTTILTAWLKHMESTIRTHANMPSASANTDRMADGVEFIPCAYFAAHATLKGFLGHGLNFYDTFTYKNSDVHQLQQALTQHITTCHTQIVAIDQLQALKHVNAGSTRVSEAIKYLMDTCPNLFIIGAGISLEQLNILSDGHGGLGTELGQTGSRFIVHTVNPFTLDTTKTTQEFLQLLATLEKHFPLMLKQAGDLTGEAELIMDLTAGRMGAIMQLLRAAAQTAIITDTERITRRILERTRRAAFTETLSAS